MCVEVQDTSKIKHFRYMAGRNKIPCTEQLVKRKWRGGDKNCKLCLGEESTTHVLFTCPIAKFAWSVIAIVLNLPNVSISFWDCNKVVTKKMGFQGEWWFLQE